MRCARVFVAVGVVVALARCARQDGTATETATAGPDQLSGAPSAREGLGMAPPAPAASLREPAARSLATASATASASATATASATASAPSSPLDGAGIGHAPEWNMPRAPQGKLAVAVNGPMDATVARRVIAPQLSRVTHCLEVAILAQPSARRAEARARPMVAKLTVGADGTVQKAPSTSWGSAQAEAPLAPCVEVALRPLRFPPSTAEVVVTTTITAPAE